MRWTVEADPNPEVARFCHFEDVEHLNKGRAARANGWHRNDLVFPVGFTNRRPLLCLVGCEILGRDEPAGLDPETDIRKQSLGATQSVDALKDQKNRPFFWSGGLPTGSVLNLATTPAGRSG